MTEAPLPLPLKFFTDGTVARFLETVAWSLIENSVIGGDIDISTVSDAELIATVLHSSIEGPDDAAGGDPESQPSDFTFGSRHDSDLLVEADAFLDRKKADLATLLYATWIEHWVNRIILLRSLGSGTPPDIAVALIRSASLALKTGKVWTALDLPAFDKDLVKAINRTMEARNGFVHFKWPDLPEEEHNIQIDSRRAQAREAKATVAALMKLEDALFFAGRTASIRETFRRTYSERLAQHLADEEQAEQDPSAEAH